MNIDKHQWNDLVGGVRAASLVALLTAGAIAGMAMSAQAAPDKPAAEQCRKPRQTAGDLELVAEYAEDIFYLARINAWHRIDKKARLFKLQPAAASSPRMRARRTWPKPLPIWNSRSVPGTDTRRCTTPTSCCSWQPPRRALPFGHPPQRSVARILRPQTGDTVGIGPDRQDAGHHRQNAPDLAKPDHSTG